MDKETLSLWESELLATQERTERQLDHVRALLAEFVGAAVGVVVGAAIINPQALTRRRRSPTQNDVAADTTVFILKKSMRPMNRTELFDMVVAEGLTFGGKTPVNTYGAILSRDDRFIKTGARGVWGLSEWVQRETAPVEESRPSLSSDVAVPESVDGATLEVVRPPGPSGFNSPLRHQEG